MISLPDSSCCLMSCCTISSLSCPIRARSLRNSFKILLVASTMTEWVFFLMMEQAGSRACSVVCLDLCPARSLFTCQDFNSQIVIFRINLFSIMLFISNLGFKFGYLAILANVQPIISIHNTIHLCDPIVWVSNFSILIPQLICLVVDNLLDFHKFPKSFVKTCPNMSRVYINTSSILA